MAKGSNMLGKFRGKMGGMVYRVDPDAGQVVSEYNPHPSNPNTAAQVDQRGKMNLAGRISAMTPYDAIIGLSTSRRKARAAFVSDILRHTEIGATGEPGERKASVVLTDCKFSKGVNVPLTFSISAVKQTKTATLAITLGAYETPIMFYRVITIVNVGDVPKYILVKDAAKAAGATQNVDVVLPIANTDWEGAMISMVVVPVVESNAEAHAVYDLINGTTADVFEANFTRSLVSLNAFAASIYAGSQTLED